ncbi:ArsR/SmtB family transcription factor [Trueperella sp. LYQ141]|uniref:ArsR/SmtB family transcription factor n=1 Tax=Trueperella sp. LYQ141 TaxID=3391058 RepID=UPI003983A47C
MSMNRWEQAAEIFSVLGNAHRLAILETLAHSPARVGDLVDQLALSQPAVSQHLRVLRAAQLVDFERHGREIIYRLRDQHVAHIVGDALKHVAEEPHAHSANTDD